MISTSTLEHLIRDYGYWALLVGTFLEGETILIIGGFSARLGLLELPYVMLIAFIGSLSGDQLSYFIGYFKGRELLSKHPAWQKRVDKIYRLIERYRNLIMLGFRFVYGMRVMTPFCIAMCKDIRISRFVLLNAAGAVIWSVSVSAGGYLFGYALERFIKNFKRYELHALVTVAFFGIVLWGIHKYREKRKP
jgi:membrane protein DedA with SNARE-associated domain